MDGRATHDPGWRIGQRVRVRLLTVLAEDKYFPLGAILSRSVDN
jgi:hypothetical protein